MGAVILPVLYVASEQISASPGNIRPVRVKRFFFKKTVQPRNKNLINSKNVILKHGSTKQNPCNVQGQAQDKRCVIRKEKIKSFLEYKFCG